MKINDHCNVQERDGKGKYWHCEKVKLIREMSTLTTRKIRFLYMGK